MSPRIETHHYCETRCAHCQGAHRHSEYPNLVSAKSPENTRCSSSNGVISCFVPVPWLCLLISFLPPRDTGEIIVGCNRVTIVGQTPKAGAWLIKHKISCIRKSLNSHENQGQNLATPTQTLPLLPRSVANHTAS